MNDLINVGIIIGGRSVECEISLISGLQAYLALDNSKYNKIIFYLDKMNNLYIGDKLSNLSTYKEEMISNLTKVGLINIDNQVYYYNVLKPRKKYPIDIFVPVVHGYGVEDGTISGFLDMYDAIYTSSDLISSATIQDKVLTKALLDKYNIDNIKYEILNEETYDEDYKTNLRFPIIVKPSYLGSSIGVKVVNSFDELHIAILESFNYTNRVLLENALTNYDEYNCAVIKDHDIYITSCVEEVKHTKDILTFVEKYENDLNKLSDATNRIIPALIDNNLENQIRSLSQDIYKLFNLSGVVRIDYLYDNENNQLYVNEINNIPGSLAFYLFEPLNISFTKLLDILIQNAIINFNKKRKKITFFKSNILAKKSSKLMTK